MGDYHRSYLEIETVASETDASGWEPFQLRLANGHHRSGGCTCTSGRNVRIRDLTGLWDLGDGTRSEGLMGWIETVFPGPE